jgi:UDP-N-acetylglucosamine:LPS N-acetylglucosamine transferase
VVTEGTAPGRIKVLAVSSGGGHWVQLQRLREAFDGAETVYVCSDPGHRDEVPDARFFSVQDASRENPLLLVKSFFQVLRIVSRERPDVVISSGAAPGLFAVALGRLLGARTIWVDSIANAEQLSMSGRLVRPFAHLWLTQWPHLASEDGPVFRGNVL